MLVTMTLRVTENSEIPPSALVLRQGLSLQSSRSPWENTEQSESLLCTCACSKTSTMTVHYLHHQAKTILKDI